jgi:FtsP/CotA-like multicopper oxidase with cupredoxin domain/fibronectin type 3 domain-containing protein
MSQGLAQQLILSPNVDYSKPNYAYSGPIQKFVDTLPGLGAAGANGVGQYIPLALANTPYGSPYGTTNDYYEVGLVEYIAQMHTNLPASGTKIRGYVQIVPSGYAGAVALTTANGCSMNVTNGAGQQMYGLTKPHYLGPLIVATSQRAVRLKFMNLLPTGTQGNLFIPVDTTTIMGAGDGWKQTGTDGNGLPVYEKYTQNRATIHLHGGLPPWISDGTPHQWTVPAGEVTSYKKGASAVDVPDMGASQDGVITFYWPNQMSGRLMFYHDHAWGMTSATVYSGQAAGYLLVDPVEESALATAGVPGTIVTSPITGNYVGTPDLAHLIPVVIQDKTFVPPYNSITNQDPNWLTDVKDWMTGQPPAEGSLWFPHVYIPNQWPDNPDQSGSNPLGRWDWGPWFWPIWPVAPGVVPPTVSHAPEAFMDTMTVNGQPYPYQNVAPTKYRLRILNACNDRMVNLQLYKATPGIITNIVVTAAGSGYDPAAPPFVTISGGNGRGATATAVVGMDGSVIAVDVDIVGSGYATVPTVTIDPPASGVGATATAQIYTLPTEVGMVPASPTAGINFPAPWRIQTVPYTPDILDGRVGGIPDPTNRGPAMVQIGTEGGLLPAPVVLPNTPVGYEENKKNIVVLNVKEKTLFLAPAERADVVVDFTPFAGQTVILYNDSGAPVPAADGRNDLYTGNPDYTGAGGAPSTLAGMGPSTRTIMAFKVSGTPTTTVPDYVTPGLVTALTSTLKTLFVSEQPAPVVSEAAYNGFYSGGSSTNTYSHIQNTSLTFVPYGSTHLATMQMMPKTIQELFDDVGRLNATLGTELPFTTWAIQTTVPLNYVDPATENFNDGETQIWKVTHNGVDSHGVHFHLFDVQVINRVGWDGQITPPDANERGWKDTVRMNPLEDIIVAMRAVKPTSLPFGVPKSARLLNPAVPTNSLVGFSNLDPLSGNAFVPPMSNVWTSFEWEYVWHCHILGHEDNDMMRPVVMTVVDTVPNTASVLTATLLTSPALQVNLAWQDNSVNEIGFNVYRKTDSNTTFDLIGQVGANSRTFSDTTIATGHTYTYYVVAYNSAGPSGDSNQASVSTVTGQLIPTSLTAIPSALSTSSPTVVIRFMDNAISETGFTLQRATDALFTANVTTFTLPANTVGNPATVGIVTYTNTGVAEARTYYYQVRANGSPANSAWSNIGTATTPGRLPVAPSNVRSGGNTRTSIIVRWNDNSNNETGFSVYRSASATGPWTLVTTTTANATSTTVTGLVRNRTYFFQVIGIDAYGQSAPAVSAGLPTLP